MNTYITVKHNKPEKRSWLSKKQLQIEATFAVYMFTPYEKFAFCTYILCLGNERAQN